MNGVHDVGGMHGFGPVEREENEPVFHDRWEGIVRVMTAAVASQRIYNLDEMRYGIERIDPVRYLAGSYYEKWLLGLELSLREKGVLGDGEVEARLAELRQEP